MVAMLDAVAATLPVVLPLHPRGAATLRAAGLRSGPRLRVIEPLGYVPFLSLVRGATVVVTDSGGIQEETTDARRPVPDRPPQHGAADHHHPRHQPAGHARGGRRTRSRPSLADPPRPPDSGPPLWDGHAGERIASSIVDWLARTEGRREAS